MNQGKEKNMCFCRDERIEEMVDGAVKVREEARCLQRGTWAGMGCNGFGEPWLQGEQSLETSVPSTDTASVGNEGCRIFKPGLVKPCCSTQRKPDIAPWSSSPNKVGKKNPKPSWFFLFAKISVSSEMVENVLTLYPSLKKTMNPSFSF